MKGILNHFQTLLKGGIATLTSRKDYKPIDNFLEKDWQNMIILDGCRYDMLSDANPFDSEVQEVYSNASHTLEFLRNNLKKRDNSDIVYVTASPQVARMNLGLHDRYDVWSEKWNDDHGTVMPQDVTEAAKRAVDEHPNKRIIVHYMQPHYPFIGEKAEDIDSPIYDSFFTKKKTVWEQLEDDELSLEKVKEAYRENLDIVLKQAIDLVEELQGKTVITSDHGNVYGKRIGLAKVYGHGYGWSDRDIARVGWIEINSDETKEIERGESSRLQGDEEKIKEKLGDLGYGV